MQKVFRYVLLATGIICLSLSAYYVVQIITQDLWYDVTTRVAQILQFFGGMTLITLSFLLKQNKAKQLKVEIHQLEYAKGLPFPSYQTKEAAGMDLLACLPDGALTLEPMQRLVIPCGFKMALPAGYEAQIRPRSGLALKHGISMPNSPGTIDADYRGEVGVLTINLGSEAFIINHGDRIAQMVIAKAPQAKLVRVNALSSSERGEGGFGSTGK